MAGKRKSTKALQKARSFKLKDLLDQAGIRIELWAVDDPPKSYEANACDVIIEARELVLVFGQNPPRGSKPLTAISVGMPLGEASSQMAGFAAIRERLEKQKFTRAEEDARQLDLSHLEHLTEHTYTRFSAEFIRGASGDAYTILDFYKRPNLTLEMIRARPDEDFELVPAVRVCCPALVLSLLLRRTDEVLKEVES